ncbi:hypothetical protein AAC387_Pa09g1093 [Persea americana]
MKGASRKKERGGGNEDSKNKKMKKEFIIEDGEVLESSDSFPSLAVFEFPWNKDKKIVPELDDWTLDDVFSSSLIDDQFQLDGDGLCRIPSDSSLGFQDDTIEELWPSKKEEIDGADSIWGCVLSQPLSIKTGKVSSCSSLK